MDEVRYSFARYPTSSLLGHRLSLASSLPLLLPFPANDPSLTFILQGSAKAFAEDPDSKKFLNDPEAQQYVQKTLKLSDITVSDYDAVFYVGGHGPVIDLPVDTTSQKIIREFYESGKITSAVCHGESIRG
jgi:putative intracellular protease/amidase